MFLSVFQQEVMLQILPAILKLGALSHKKKWGENVESLEQGLKPDNSWAECGLQLLLYTSRSGLLALQPVLT